MPDVQQRDSRALQRNRASTGKVKSKLQLRSTCMHKNFDGTSSKCNLPHATSKSYNCTSMLGCILETAFTLCRNIFGAR